MVGLRYLVGLYVGRIRWKRLRNIFARDRRVTYESICIKQLNLS